MLLLNDQPEYRSQLDPVDRHSLSAEAASDAVRAIGALEGYQPTPLVSLPSLASSLNVQSVQVKDESRRFGLSSFKAVGGSYAVARLVLEVAEASVGRKLDMCDLKNPQVRAVAAGLVFACATDGNHGRSVAYGARLVGARAVIFVHAGVSPNRVTAISDLGAEVVRVDGTYDDAVACATRVSAERGWLLISDTSWPGYECIPMLVMQGYTVLLTESLEALAPPPTHVFVQAGVGGLAAATAGHFAMVLGRQRPSCVIVEPDRAACLYASVEAGHRVKLHPGQPTVMSMLECYEPSFVAWRILSRTADAFMTVTEEEAVAVMKLLAHPLDGDPRIEAGESGGVGLAGLIQAANSPTSRELLGLNASSRVFVINTEGATDPSRYEELVGLSRPA